MIKSTKGKISEAVLTGTLTKGFPADLVRAAQRKLAILHAATTVDDLRVPPGNRLEKLSGDREGQHSIRINGACVSAGTAKMPMMLKSSIIIERRHL